MDAEFIAKQGWYAPRPSEGGEMGQIKKTFIQFAVMRGHSQISLRALASADRRAYLDLQDEYLIETDPLFEWLAGSTNIRKYRVNNWWSCNFCSYPPCETLPEMKAHFQITHPEKLPKGGECL